MCDLNGLKLHEVQEIAGLDQVGRCGKASNLSSDFPMGGRKFISELVYSFH